MFAKLPKVTVSFVLSVCPSTWNNLAATGRIFMKFYIWIVLKICQENSSFSKSGKNNRYFTWRPKYVFSHTLHGSFWNVKCCRQKLSRKSKHAIYVQWYPPPQENRAVYEVMWKKYCGLWHVPIACWIPKATNTHTEVKLIAFPLPQRLNTPPCYVIRTLPVLHCTSVWKRRYRIQEVKLCLCSYITPCRHVAGV
jgi:hypothetical protein